MPLAITAPRDHTTTYRWLGVTAICLALFSACISVYQVLPHGKFVLQTENRPLTTDNVTVYSSTKIIETDGSNFPGEHQFLLCALPRNNAKLSPYQRYWMPPHSSRLIDKSILMESKNCQASFMFQKTSAEIFLIGIGPYQEGLLTKDRIQHFNAVPIISGQVYELDDVRNFNGAQCLLRATRGEVFFGIVIPQPLLWFGTS